MNGVSVNNEAKPEDISTPNFDSLLQVEKEEKPIEKPVDETPKPQFAPATPPTDVYFPPLDKEPANMAFADPYASANSLSGGVPTNNNQTVNQQSPINNAINQVKETVKKIEESGHSVVTEEFDLGNEYQIIIKIKKELQQ